MDEEKGTAKFDKARKVLTVTLPVLPPSRQAQLPTPSIVTPLEETDSPKQPAGGEGEAEDLKEEKESVVEDGLKPKVTMIESTDDTVADLGVCLKEEEASVIVPAAAAQDTHVRTHAQWSAKGEWVCPPFSYRQEDAIIAFCLHTPFVKKSSLVQYFDQHYVRHFLS